MWDLTVPGSCTFLTADGTAVFDTMSVHVPVSTAANDEARSMLPSSMIFSPRDKSLFFSPTQESVLGLYQMTRQDGKETGMSFQNVREAMQNKDKIGDFRNRVNIGGITAPLGSHLVNSALPKEIREYDAEFNKGKVKEKLEYVARGDKENFGPTVNYLKDLGNMAATGEGNTIAISDFTSFMPVRDQLMKKFETQFSKLDRLKRVEERDMKKEKLMSQLSKDLESEQKAFFQKNRNNGAGTMFMSGSRGTPDQVRQTIGASVMVRDYFNNTSMMPVKHNYIEGQTMAENLAAAQSARYGAVKKVRGVAEPGAFAKSLVAANMNAPVTLEDCGTKNGIEVNPKDAIGRNLAEDIDGIGLRNEVFTAEDYSTAKRKGLNKIKIRSQITCEAEKGVCSLCYGYDEHGRLPEIGRNVGIVDAHSLSEPLTQSLMKEFHKGGLAKTKTVRAQGFDRIKQIYNVPENLPGMAIMTDIDGKVEKIERSPAGGLDITVAGKTFYSPSPDQLVKPGQEVKKGDQISEGYLRPQDILELKGRREAQDYMVEGLRTAFEDSGISSDRRPFESIVTSQTSFGKVTESDHPDLIVGDVTKINLIEKFKQEGYKIKYQPLIRPIDRIPTDDTYSGNLFQKMNFRELQKNIKTDIASGKKIKVVNTTDPIASYIMGNFGKDDNGNPTTFY
jgi:DNA-directed RNA polymerase subunit beta'